MIAEGQAFVEAVKLCVSESQHQEILDTWDNLMREHGGPSGRSGPYGLGFED